MVFMRRRGGPDLHQPSQLVKNSQPRWGGGGSGEVGMVSQLLPGFEFGSLPLGKVAKLGEGNRQAAKRRAWAKAEEEKREAARRAHWAANVNGRGIRGQFAIPSN